jgi:RNA polymerase sigma-70 factor (ECF subfamily)
MVTGGLIEELWRCQQGKLVGHLTRMLKSPELAQEVAQEAFAKFYMTSQTCHIEFARQFLFKTATNFAFMRLRRLRLERKFFEDSGEATREEVADDGPEPERTALSDELIRHMNTAVDALNPRQRAAFIMAYVEEKPRKEIAILLGISERRLDKCLTGALKRCRKNLAEHTSDRQRALLLQTPPRPRPRRRRRSRSGSAPALPA